MTFIHRMAVALTQSEKTPTELAQRERQEMQQGELQSVKVSVVMAKINARKHLKQIKYLSERYTVVQEHYQLRERLITADICDILERKQSVEEEKLFAETQLSSDREVLQKKLRGLRSAEEHFCDLLEKRKMVEMRRAGMTTTWKLALTTRLTSAADDRTCRYSETEESVKEDISKFHGWIANSEQKIHEVGSAIASLSATISQLNSKKSSYMSQRSRLQDELDKIKGVIIFLQDAQMYGSNDSLATECAIQHTGITDKVVTRDAAREYTLFDSSGTKQVHASFEEAWDAFEEMREKGNNYSFVMDFECTQCNNPYQQLPHIHKGKLVCAGCHLPSKGGCQCAVL